MSRVARLLNTRVEVWRTSTAPDGMGGWVETVTQVGTERARLAQPSASERVVAQQFGSRLTHVVYLNPGANVLRGDELRQAGRAFRVLAIFEPSEPETYLRADCERTQPEGAA
ncbi:Phage head-tail joining protein [Saccharopolyspora kobensis]|uniref:Phage head-tail joining protein n=1 Tax=Saccharopolyspora kobensis TaxID=146035 RepID=A0A1H6ELU3_9PSEU|nr:head-tail adaptor protein [Saccharopolyspora kobensis]SEG98830.1 Phage head-tail joining protein [Saccharopolyspora kobensis]SFD23067.1 Phage head-tail joining protein [Saccharopolyspora kobensis]